ncbi:MAG: branched-chain amino acid aminotransferase [Candidatus Competibacterales bacterium]
MNPLHDLTLEKRSHSQRPQGAAKVAFGSVFADHMFTLDYSDGRWHSPRIRPYGPIALDPACATLHYGQTVFEGLKAFAGVDGRVRLFRPDANAKRLADSCRRMCIPPVDPELFVAAVRALVGVDRAWVPHEPGHSLYIRPVLFATESHLEVRPSQTFQLVVFTAPVGAYLDVSAVALKVQTEFCRAAPGGVGAAKTAGNYAASLLPTAVSQAEGYHQTLWLDGASRRYVEEAGYMNVFFLIDDTVITPPLGGTILPGVTRDCALTLLRQRGQQVEERPITIDEVFAASETGRLREVFGTGTAAVVSAVGKIAWEGRELVVNHGQPGPLTTALGEEITAIQRGRLADAWGWTVVVDDTALPAASDPAVPVAP